MKKGNQCLINYQVVETCEKLQRQQKFSHYSVAAHVAMHRFSESWSNSEISSETIRTMVFNVFSHSMTKPQNSKINDHPMPRRAQSQQTNDDVIVFSDEKSQNDIQPRYGSMKAAVGSSYIKTYFLNQVFCIFL